MWRNRLTAACHRQDQRPERPWEEPQRHLSCASLWWPRAELPREPRNALGSWGWNPANSGFTLPCELFFKRTDCHPNTFSQDHLWCYPERISTCRGQRLGYHRPLPLPGLQPPQLRIGSLPAFHSFLPFLLSPQLQGILGNLQERHKTKLSLYMKERLKIKSQDIYIHMKVKTSLGGLDLREAHHYPKLLSSGIIWYLVFLKPQFKRKQSFLIIHEEKIHWFAGLSSTFPDASHYGNFLRGIFHCVLNNASAENAATVFPRPFYAAPLAGRQEHDREVWQLERFSQDGVGWRDQGSVTRGFCLTVQFNSRIRNRVGRSGQTLWLSSDLLSVLPSSIMVSTTAKQTAS